MVARLLALTAAAEHADLLEPTGGPHHLSPGCPSHGRGPCSFELISRTVSAK